MALSPEELKSMIMLQRQVAWQFDLDKYTEDQIRLLRGSLFKAKLEIKSYLNSISPAEWSAERLDSVLAEVRGLSLAVEGDITNGLSEGFIEAGREALNAQNNMLSYGGRVAGFNFAGLGPGQLASMAANTAVGGQLLNTWVKDIFDRNMLIDLRREALTGLLKGEGYPKFVKRFEAAFTKLSKSEIITLARSYVQAANVNAQKEVYRQNPELVPFVEWSAVLEPGFYTTGRGTCIRCAALDGQIFTLDTAPPIPLHPRCRCVLLPKTPTYQELGLDIDEIQSSYRPYTMRGNKNIDAGGRRKILEVGFHDGDYSTWMAKRPESFQKNVLGPARFELYQSGKIQFNQFVNNVTGELYTLEELKSFIGGRPPSGFSPKGALKPKKTVPVLPKRSIQAQKTAPVPLPTKKKVVTEKFSDGSKIVDMDFVVDGKLGSTKVLKDVTLKSDNRDYIESVRATKKTLEKVEATKLLPSNITFDEVRLIQGRNPADGYWARKYKIKGFKSAATAGEQGGKRVLNIWGLDTTGAKVKRALPHEIAHVAAKNLTGSYDLGRYKNRWRALMKKEGYSSGYAKRSKSVAEDFADYFRGRVNPYTVNAVQGGLSLSGNFSLLFPGKTKLFNQIIKENSNGS